MLISCLHTNAENVSFFEAAAPPGVTLTHFLRPEFYLRAAEGNAADALAAEVAAQLRKMSEGADAVLTASALLSRFTAPPAVSADALLARAIEQHGAVRRVELFHSAPLAEALIPELYGEIRGTAELLMTPLPDAWDALRKGDKDAHTSVLRAAIDRSDADVVALTEPAMGGVANYDKRILSLPQVALRSLRGNGAKRKHRESVF